MQVVKYILMALYIFTSYTETGTGFLRTKVMNGASGTIVGSTTSNFYEKNKSRTHEGKLKKWTMILGGTFIVLTVALGIVYVI